MPPPKKTDPRATVVTEAIRLASQVKSVFAGGIDDAMGRIFPDKRVGTRAIVGAGGKLGDVDVTDLEIALREHRENVVKAGLAGLEKVEAGGAKADLDPTQLAGMEALLSLTARPAIEFTDGHFDKPQPPWTHLEDERPRIEATATAVGRIEMDGDPRAHYAGTGFLVGPDVVMTNRHVVELFAVPDRKGRWSFRAGITPGIDWFENPDAAGTDAVEITEVIGVHRRFDLALLRIAGDGSLPRPLVLAGAPPDPIAKAPVYVIGYPAFDRRNGGEAQRLLFADRYDVKQLQPGEILGLADQPGIFNHDCSTLGGNSGSCVVSLADHRVVGLHFRGEYLKYNQAIALWPLKHDALLSKAIGA